MVSLGEPFNSALTSLIVSRENMMVSFKRQNNLHSEYMRKMIFQSGTQAAPGEK